MSDEASVGGTCWWGMESTQAARRSAGERLVGHINTLVGRNDLDPESRDGATTAVFLEGDTYAVEAFALLPGSQLVRGGDDKTVRIWSPTE